MSQVPTTNINALYTNTTTGTIISPTIMDAAIADLVATINTNDTAFGVLAAAGGVGTTNLANLSVTTAKIALLAVTAAQIANETITSAQILDGSIATSDIANLAITTAKIALLAIGAAQIANNAITALQIANATITTTQLADSSVTSAKIVDGTIVNADINTSAAIDGSKLANLSITSSQIADGTILDIDINAAAAIAWTKISKSASSLADLATRLASDLTGTLNVAQLPALTGDITTSAGSAVTTLSVSGVVAGTYNNVTVDAKGRVTFGQNLIATQSVAGDMSAADKTKLDGISSTGLNSFTVPADQAITFGGRFKIVYTTSTDTLDIYET